MLLNPSKLLQNSHYLETAIETEVVFKRNQNTLNLGNARYNAVYNIFLSLSYRIYTSIYTVTYRPIARQRHSKHIPAGANARNNRTSTYC
jgi:hypothetical protein